MAGYAELIGELEGVFGAAEWLATGVKVYPSNFSGAGDHPGEYLVSEVLPSRPLTTQYGGDQQVAGIVIIQIYIPVNEGTRRVYDIADMLDNALQKKVFNFNIQTRNSSLDIKGNDGANASLFRADYVVSFESY